MELLVKKGESRNHVYGQIQTIPCVCTEIWNIALTRNIWRCIFILEGLLTVAVAFAASSSFSTSPETASFLTTEEKAWVVY